MKLIRILVALAALPAAIFQAHAGIGWDLKECEQHYGSPVGGPFEGRHGDSHNYHFHARSWEIWANFSDSTNRVIMISYITQNQQLLEKNWNELLQENAPGVTRWQPDPEANERLHRRQWNGAVGQDNYTVFTEHDATGRNHSLTIIYNRPSQQD
jgi:hypothetical protein